MSRLVLYFALGVATCVLGLAALVVHTRALTAAHLEVAHQFNVFEEPKHSKRGAAPLAAPPPALCAPDAASGAVGQPQTELWGDVVVAGAGVGSAAGHTAPSAAACCEACEATRGCNVFVWCAEEASCGQQCWLKRVGDPVAAVAHGSGAGVPWTSGALPKDADVQLGSLPPPDESIKGIVIATPKGDIRLRLRPEWSASSVAFVRLLAAHPLCTPACEFYRAEPGFLLQGSLRALIPSNNVTTKGPRAMQRGDVGWAGASFGPDWFVYLGREPATHWGTDHTVWAEVADSASLATADAIAALPPLPTKPGEMHILRDRVKIDVRRDRAALLL